ncbi:MAG: hypothetical protein HGA61_02525 [Candidatus Moranbacteria bacterium]|nr:hypothetical protein [Candidatus Moranbacteria bacterium]
MKNQTKKTENKIYTTSEVGVILERVEDTVKILAESHVSLAKKQDEMQETLVNMDNRLGRVEIRLDSVETKIDRLQDDMVEVKFELKKKVSTDDFEKLEKRVVKNVI